MKKKTSQLFFPLHPRERLLVYGAEVLSEQELLAILLRTGMKGRTVYDLAGKVLQNFETLHAFRQAAIPELTSIPGIGEVKATELKAMMELGKRLQVAPQKKEGKILNSHTIGCQLVKEMSDLNQEHLIAFYLDNKGQIIQKKTIYIGTVNQSPAVPRDILQPAIKLMATGLFIAHNHPSGIISPSPQDEDFTDKLSFACETMGITFIDHIIIGYQQYFSFKENRLLV